MTAKKLKFPEFDFVAYIEERLGEVAAPPDLWLEQVKKSAAAGHVEPELLLHIFTNLTLENLAYPRRGYSLCKRMVDLALIIAVTPFLFVLFAMIACAIKVDSKGPVFFKQTRIGFLGRPFTIWKFRTMYEGSEAMLGQVPGDSTGSYFKSSTDPRTTKMGKFLRRWSLDETPQAINIFLGNMTLIGPRPLPIYDVAAIPYRLLGRFAVQPGLTGLWQVMARDSKDGRKNLALDKLYVDQFGPKLDLWILWRTPWIVLKGTGAR